LPGIPIVLLDRSFLPYPSGSPYDLVAIDHRRAGFIATEHLLKLGCKRIAFVAYTHSASTVDARIAGYREGLFVGGVPLEPSLVWRLRGNGASDLARKNHVNPGETGSLRARRLLNSRFASV
jgi:DNA-binding LacI/PurR family transcriptional regulator